MKINDEIIYLTIFLVLNVFLASGIFKDIKQLITKRTFMISYNIIRDGLSLE